jgi:hypothetical protein
MSGLQRCKDAENPQFIFSMTDTQLLIDVIKGTIDINQLAKIELANRGLNMDGAWVGFKQAREELEV